jgi:methyl-accepting chemotaxis protein
MSREEFNELIYYISQLKHQYNRKIDEQTEKINEQNTVIEELLWQLRELSDKVRQLNDNVKSLETKLDENSGTSDSKSDSVYENNNFRHKNLNNIGKIVDKEGDNSDNGEY